MQKRVAIIGGGASGLFCAIECAKNGLQVTIFEQNEKCGKKILVSGNGRCNITNRDIGKYNYHSENPEFVSYALAKFDAAAFERYVATMGLLLHKNEDGRCYPLSQEAKSVVLLFTSYAESLGVKIQTQQKITDVKKLLDSFDAVVVATGTQAAPHLGGNEDGLAFAASVGHTIYPTYPALVQLHTKEHFIHKMAGAKLEAEVTLFINNTKTLTKSGDLLFTPYGVSGLAILDISQAASQALLSGADVTLALNLLPEWNMQRLSSYLGSFKESTLELFALLCGLLPQKVVTHLLESLAIDGRVDAATLGAKNAKKIANAMTNLRITITQTHGFRHAEVSGGGVATEEIDAKTFESKKCKNLYFIGEVLDVDGDRGGYNFGWCWASAFCAVQSISKV